MVSRLTSTGGSSKQTHAGETVGSLMARIIVTDTTGALVDNREFTTNQEAADVASEYLKTQQVGDVKTGQGLNVTLEPNNARPAFGAAADVEQDEMSEDFLDLLLDIQ